MEKPETSPPSRTYAHQVVLLRSIAISAVILYHYAPNLAPLGYLGVDLFFILSGYLIGGRILEEKSNKIFSYKIFLQERFIRIAPAYIAVLTSTFFAGLLLLGEADFSKLTKEIFSSSMFLYNFSLWSEVGYFDIPSQSKPLLHLWSLSVEMQFYLIIPLLCLLKRRYVVIIAGVSFFSWIFLSNSHPEAAFYLLPLRLWEFLLGVFLALVLPLHSLQKTPRYSSYILPYLFIGNISYALYLWHWPILTFARLTSYDEPTALQKLFLLALTLVLATLSTYALEKPLRRSSRKAEIVSILLLLLLSVAGLAKYSEQPQPHHLSSNQSCMLLGLQDTTNKMCQVIYKPEQTAKKRLVIWGDSHAQHLHPALLDIARRNNLDVISITLPNCPPLLGATRHADKCEYSGYPESALASIKFLQPDYIIVAARWPQYMATQAIQIDGHQATLEDISNSLEHTALQLREIAPLLIIASMPILNRYPKASALATDQYKHLHYSLPDSPRALTYLQHQHAINVLWPWPILCPQNQCMIVLKNILLYQDQDHLSSNGALLFVSPLEKWLDEADLKNQRY